MIRYIYFNKTNSNINHEGITCIGYKYTDDNNVEFGVSFCSPSDPFSRKKAHSIINGRMKIDKKDTISLEPGETSYKDVVLGIADYIDGITPKDIDDLVEMKRNRDELYPRLAGVKLPLWFRGIKQ